MKDCNQKILKETGHTKPSKPVEGSTQYTRLVYDKNTI